MPPINPMTSSSPGKLRGTCCPTRPRLSDWRPPSTACTDRQTKAESLLWNVLRAKRLCGLKFRRQHPIGRFFADFACVSRRVIVELDGGYHDYQHEDDLSRQRYLEDQGWSVMRFPNEDVLDDVEAVAISIAKQSALNVEFGKRKPAISGMKSRKKPSPGLKSPTSPVCGRGDYK